MIKKLKNMLQLLKHVDLEQLDAISKKVDIPTLMDGMSKMSEEQLKGMAKLLTSNTKRREAPEIDADFYDIEAKLSSENRTLQLKVREFLEREIKPIVNKYGLHDEFPFELTTKLAA